MLEFEYLDREDERALPKPPERKALPRAKAAPKKKPPAVKKVKP
jgi:ATP-dependent Clp protease ATP-binding subunit ClpA